MALAARRISNIQLVNGSSGDPVLFIDYPGKNDALLFDAGDLARLEERQLKDLAAVFITHHHIDHFMGFDRVLRACLDSDKTVHIFGPLNTIDKIYHRIESYEFMYFPFHKLVLEVTEIHGDTLRRATLCCQRRFPRPEIVEQPWEGPVIYRDGNLSVEAVAVDHTVPCLAYALVEHDGHHPDRDKLARGELKPGPWVGKVLDRLAQSADEEEEVTIAGGRFRLRELVADYFTVSKGARIAFVTDTAWSDASKPGLIALAQRAEQLYCDCFYAQAQAKQADQYRHMTTADAAALAQAAKVKELIVMHFSGRYRGRYHKLLAEVRELFPNASGDF